MTWGYQDHLRASLDCRCTVEGCDASFRIDGPWGSFPRLPPSMRALTVPPGWLHQRRRYLAHPGVYVDTGIFCPDHAPTWRAYVARVSAWDAARKRARKTHWLATLTRWFGPQPQPPKSPFGGE